MKKSEICVGYRFILHLLYNKVFVNFCENVFGYDVWCPLFITWVTGFHRACLHVVWFRLQWNAELCSTLIAPFRHLQDFSLALNEEFMINIAASWRFAFLVMWFHYFGKWQSFCKHLFVGKWKRLTFYHFSSYTFHVIQVFVTQPRELVQDRIIERPWCTLGDDANKIVREYGEMEISRPNTGWSGWR